MTRKLGGDSYYGSIEFRARGDCIYRIDDNQRFLIRDDARFHSLGFGITKDVGGYPEYKNSQVLVSNEFRYFGNCGTADWKLSSPQLKDLVENMGQGHRVNYAPELHDELKILKEQVWQEAGPGCHGVPLHAPSFSMRADSDEGYEVSKTVCNYFKEPPICG